MNWKFSLSIRNAAMGKAIPSWLTDVFCQCHAVEITDCMAWWKCCFLSCHRNPLKGTCLLPCPRDREVSVHWSDGFLPFLDLMLWVSLSLCHRLHPKKKGLGSLAGFHLWPCSSLLHPVGRVCVLVSSTSERPEPVLTQVTVFLIWLLCWVRTLMTSSLEI